MNQIKQSKHRIRLSISYLLSIALLFVGVKQVQVIRQALGGGRGMTIVSNRSTCNVSKVEPDPVSMIGETKNRSKREIDDIAPESSQGKQCSNPEMTNSEVQQARNYSLASIEKEIHLFSDISPEKRFSQVNNAMDRELEAGEIAEDFGERMEGLFRDKGADEMVRNFAVQHLERFAQERTVRGTWDVDSDEAAAIRAALEDAALEVDNSIGGTAMLALARLSEIDPHVDRRRLSSRSASLVANPSARLSTRIAAAQLCGLLRVRSALPDLRSLASDPSVPTPLRLAADHAAGLVSESR